MTPPQVVLYTRRGCHLCDDARDVLLAHGLAPREVDIDLDAGLAQRFGTCVPVVEIDGKVRFRGRVQGVLLRRLLSHATPHSVRQFGLFAKYWESGAVKPQLAQELGPDAAAALYVACLRATLERFSTAGDRRVLAYSPVDRRTDFGMLGGDAWALEPQAEGPLGLRMRHYFMSAFQSGAGKVLLIGSDSPTLPKRFIDEAWRALDEHRVVLGPAADGGSYLVGANGGVPPILDGIEFNTPHVWQQAIDRLHAAGIHYAVLPEWYDVDQFDDLLRLADELRTLDLDAPLVALQTAVADALAGTSTS